jgi:hypothetical protein
MFNELDVAELGNVNFSKKLMMSSGMFKLNDVITVII